MRALFASIVLCCGAVAGAAQEFTLGLEASDHSALGFERGVDVAGSVETLGARARFVAGASASPITKLDASGWSWSTSAAALIGGGRRSCYGLVGAAASGYRADGAEKTSAGPVLGVRCGDRTRAGATVALGTDPTTALRLTRDLRPGLRWAVTFSVTEYGGELLTGAAIGLRWVVRRSAPAGTAEMPPAAGALPAGSGAPARGRALHRAGRSRNTGEMTASGGHAGTAEESEN